MTSDFNSDFFLGNRKKLKALLGSELIVLAANGLLQRSADTTFPFRQDSNFWYLTGIKEPDYVLVINGDSEFLIEPKRWEHRDQWDGAVDKSGLVNISGIETFYEYHEGWTKLDMLLKKYKKVHTIAPAEKYIEHFGFYTNPARATLLESLSKHRKLDVVDIRKTLARQRQVKQKPELEAIEKAIAITASGLKKVVSRLDKYKSERHIHAALTGHFIAEGADGHAYEPIIACGKNATTIHYVDNDQALVKGELLLIDTGAEYSGYSADITRTYSLSKPSRRQKQVYKAVERVQKYAIKLLKPGVDMKKYEAEVDSYMAKELKKLGLITDVNDKKKLKKYYPHLASHFLGLDTHDAADYTARLEPGMVLTVEPGIYIPEENIGIRIEDDVLITKKSSRVLSGKIEKKL